MFGVLSIVAYIITQGFLQQMTQPSTGAVSSFNYWIYINKGFL